MKAAYANGVLSAFEEAGYRPWDMIVGTSAGGALAAWYAAGQANFAEGTWDYSRDPAVLSYGRWLRGKGPVLDHDYLLDSVYVEHHPLDQAAIHNHDVPVIVTASRVADGGTTYHDLREGLVLPWLKATGRLPFGAGSPVTIDGIDYLDGGITDPIPVRYAIETRGVRDIVLIVNWPEGPLVNDNAVLARLTARRYPALRDGLLRHQARKRAAMQYAMSPPAGVRVRIIRPSGPTGLHRLTRDAEKLAAAIRRGRDDAAKHLGALCPAASLGPPTAACGMSTPDARQGPAAHPS